ncbi:MAG: SET domain-containing protein [Opitutales bacterium]
MNGGYESRPSPVSGFGLFATLTFEAGQRIAPYLGRPVYAPSRARGAPVFDLEIRPGLWLDGSGGDNPARWANHSCRPNAVLVWHDETREAWLTAARRVEAGEEITFDYGFNLAEAMAHPCHCGSPDCVGRIVAAPLRAALRRHLRPQGSRRD